MRTACPLSSAIGVTSAISAPPLLRIDSTSTGLVVSNNSHTASARRNNAAGVMVVNPNVRCSPSLSRRALTMAALPADLASGALGSGVLASGDLASGDLDSGDLDSRGASEAAIFGAGLAAGSGIGASATAAG